MCCSSKRLRATQVPAIEELAEPDLARACAHADLFQVDVGTACLKDQVEPCVGICFTNLFVKHVRHIGQTYGGAQFNLVFRLC